MLQGQRRQPQLEEGDACREKYECFLGSFVAYVMASDGAFLSL